MKKVLLNIKDFRKSNPWLAAFILAVVLFVLYKIGIWIFSKIVGAAALKTTIEQTPNIINQQNNTNPTTGIRTSTCQSIADTVYSEVKSFDQDEKYIVQQMNLLNNANEVIFISNYYRNAYGNGLKAVLKDALVADWRGGGVIGTVLNPNAEGGRFTDLKAFIQNSLL